LTNTNEHFASQWCIEPAKNGERLMIVMASWWFHVALDQLFYGAWKHHPMMLTMVGVGDPEKPRETKLVLHRINPPDQFLVTSVWKLELVPLEAMLEVRVKQLGFSNKVLI
jgi:hypothetical protein